MPRGRGKSPKTLLTDSPTDADQLTVSVAEMAPPRSNGTPPVDAQSQLAGEILTQRLTRLTKQNTKLDLEIRKHEAHLADVELMRRDVIRSSRVVMQSLHVAASPLSEQIALEDSPDEIRALLREQFSAAFADLAFAHGDGPRD